MAGESPGRSEQRKSSGESAGERDPRLAVFRERTPEASKSVAPEAKADVGSGRNADASARSGPDEVTHESPGADTPAAADRDSHAVDQPTGVFRTRPTNTEPEPESEPDSDSESGTKPGPVADADTDDASSDGDAPSSAARAGEPEAESRTNASVSASRGGGVGSGDDAAANLAEGPERGAEATADDEATEPEAESGSESGAGQSSAAGAGDSRLRAAVAAWVATADEPGTDDAADPKRNADADGDPAEDESGAAASAAIAAAAFSGARAAREADGGAQDRSAGTEDSKADGTKPSGKSPAPTTTVTDDVPAAKDDAAADKPTTAPTPSKRPEAKPVPGEPASGKSEAVKPTSGEPEPAKPTAAEPTKAGPASGKPASAKPASAKSAPGEPAEAKSAAGGAGSGRPAADEPDAAKSTAAKPTGTKPAADEPAGSKSTAGKSASAKSAPGEPAPAKPAAAERTEAGPASGKPAWAKSAPGEPAEAKSAAGGAGSGRPAADEPDAAKSTSDKPPAERAAGAKSSGGARPSGAASGAGTGKASGGRDDDGNSNGIDQATAVFKTMRPSGPKVDQPTAMLKLPPTDPQAPKAPKGGPSSKAARPESDTERTSTFVPLKPDDVRSPKSPRPPGATGATGTTGAAGAMGAQPHSASAGQPLPPAGFPEAERTRQQPLPPKPPLDLLAELTNKPAPPETPVRTTVRRFKIWTPLVLLLLVVFAVVQMVRPLPDPKIALTASPSYTFEGGKIDMPWPGDGQSAVEVEGVGSMGTEGAQKPAPIASMAKAMTAYVILKEHPLKGKETGPKVKIDQQGEDDAKKPDESTAKVTKGQEFTLRQMIELLMIPSGNNIARLLGRWDAGSEEEFVKKMNAAAKDLGMTNTTYTDPSGFDKGTVSTPLDQIKLGKAVMENDVFRKIVDLPQVEVPGIDGMIYNNNNILLKPGVNGIKTGSTTPAGGNLLFTASTIVDGKERRIIGSVMNQKKGTKLSDKLQAAIDNSLKLIEKAQEAVTSATVVKKGDVVGYVDDGLGGQTPVVATQDLKAVGWPGLKVELTAGAAAGKPVPHAAKAGDVVGEVTVGTGPGQVKAPVALQKDLVEPGFGAKLKRLG